MICKDKSLLPFNASLSTDYQSPVFPLIPESPYDETVIGYQTMNFFALAVFFGINFVIVFLVGLRRGLEFLRSRVHSRSGSLQKKMDTFVERKQGWQYGTLGGSGNDRIGLFRILMTFLAGSVWIIGMAIEWNLVSSDLVCEWTHGFSCIVVKYWMVKVFGFSVWMLVIHKSILKLLILLRFPKSPKFKSMLYYGFITILGIIFGLAAHFDQRRSLYLMNIRNPSLQKNAPKVYRDNLASVKGISGLSWCMETATWTILRVSFSSISVILPVVLISLLWRYRSSFAEIDKQIPLTMGSVSVQILYLVTEAIFSTKEMNPLLPGILNVRLAFKTIIVFLGMSMVSMYLWSCCLPDILKLPILAQEQSDMKRRASSFGHQYASARMSIFMNRDNKFTNNNNNNKFNSNNDNYWKPRLSTVTTNFLKTKGNAFSNDDNSNYDDHHEEKDELDERANRIFSRAMMFTDNYNSDQDHTVRDDDDVDVDVDVDATIVETPKAFKLKSSSSFKRQDDNSSLGSSSFYSHYYYDEERKTNIMTFK